MRVYMLSSIDDLMWKEIPTNLEPICQSPSVVSQVALGYGQEDLSVPCAQR